MTTYTCDGCGTSLKGFYHFSVGIMPHSTASFCKECARPYIALLTKAGLLRGALMREGYIEQDEQAAA